MLKKFSETNYFADVELLFLTCEMGLNPCMEYVSALAYIARNKGVFVIAVLPSNWELTSWGENEKSWISKLEKNTDILIYIPFNRLTEVNLNSRVKESYHTLVRIVAMVIKDITCHVQDEGSVQGIGILKNPSLLNNSDLRKLMKECTSARVGLGMGQGKEAIFESVENAMKCPLLTFDLKEARMVIVTVSGDVCLYEAEKITQNVAFAANFETSILWDVFPEKQDAVRVQTLIVVLK